jgi:hypothetical protein
MVELVALATSRAASSGTLEFCQGRCGRLEERPLNAGERSQRDHFHRIKLENRPGCLEATE